MKRLVHGWYIFFIVYDIVFFSFDVFYVKDWWPTAVCLISTVVMVVCYRRVLNKERAAKARLEYLRQEFNYRRD